MAKRKKSKEKGSSILARMMLSTMMKKESKFKIDLKGLGLSLIDNEPKEVLFLSVYKMSFMIEKVFSFAFNHYVVDRTAIEERSGR